MIRHCCASWVFFVVAFLPVSVRAAAFSDSWNDTPDRVWLGRDFWTNPMEDWQVANGRIECTRAGANRNVALLTFDMTDPSQRFIVSVKLGKLAGSAGSAGFRLGIRDKEIDDYRAAALRGKGIEAGITAYGELFIGNTPSNDSAKQKLPKAVKLVLVGEPDGDHFIQLSLRAKDAVTSNEIGSVDTRVHRASLKGLIALTNNGHREGKLGSDATFWFSRWEVTGDGLTGREDRAWGPILWAMHTVSRQPNSTVLKLTAQMPPLGDTESHDVQLRINQGSRARWKQIAKAKIDPLSRTATFRVDDWDSSRDVRYMVRYPSESKAGQVVDHRYTGVIRQEPDFDTPLVVAGFTGNTDLGFPNREVVRNVAIQDPHILFFSGDQIYEKVGGYGIIRGPDEQAVLNYLRKWYMLGWAFGDLMRDRLTLCLPDDHDVYQGNLWGQGGINSNGIGNHAKGGYVQSANFVNAVQRTQNSHHPVPYDPTPVAQGIGVYYGPLLYGGVSFAIIEDRKFKSGPEDKVNTWRGRPDQVRPGNPPDFDPRSVDIVGLKLLGDRQLQFLHDWAADWRGAYAKCVLSQTIFVNLANYHGSQHTFLTADLDSNGWPQTRRNLALHEMRKGFAFHYAGDQHLPSLTRYGIDQWNDAGFAFCVPSIAAGYPRSWLPDKEGRPVRNREKVGGLPNAGDYRDGLGNLITVYGVGNPAKTNRPGRINTLHDKSSGHGIVRFDKRRQIIRIECYRLQFDAANPRPEDQFPGWPKTIRVVDNYGRKPAAYLPTLKFEGAKYPVVQVIDESDGDVVYTLRARGEQFRPGVFSVGSTYTVIANSKKLTGLKPGDGTRVIQFDKD